MKVLHCNIEIYDRTLSLKRKSQNCILTFAYKSAKKSEVCLFLQMRQDKRGTNYQISGNIQQVYSKFINHGKATISLRKPCHDLFIQSDILSLKNFIRTLNHIMNGYWNKDDNMDLASNLLFSPKQFIKLQTRVVVTEKHKYPTLEGFPRTTEELFLCGLDRKSFDRQILRLQSLRCLNLSNNRISSLPKELGTLSHLNQLVLSQNCLGKSKSKWTWLDQTAIQKSLHFLDISNNLLTELPVQIGKLNALINLKVHQNMLTRLPQSIAALQNLESLDLSQNNLLYLLGGIKRLQLQFLNISENQFSNSAASSIDNSGKISLVELSAKSVIKSRIAYDANLIPYTLVEYLDETKYCCQCGNACFECYIKKFLCINPIALCIKRTNHEIIISECYFCSLKCLDNFYYMY